VNPAGLPPSPHLGRAQRRLGLRVRLSLWWRRGALIEALAEGANPDASAELTAVAGELIGMRTRQRLAAALDRVLRTAAQRTVPWGLAVPLNKREIADARDELAALAERLRATRPVPAHAVARAAMLLSQATSPLYDRASPRRAWDLARTARLALDEPIA
jgi:hypothetical protein